MYKTFRGFLSILVGVAVLSTNAMLVFGAGASAKTVNLPAPEFQNVTADEEDIPDVTDRVARISFLQGESSIRRLGAEEWEKTTLNLPIVEGDEITTDGDARVEIQFDKNQHLRIAENSYLKIANLKDEGIAVSLSLGTLSLRITAFDKDKAFFEIDAPKMTLAVQRAGAYRVDAGKEGDLEVRVSATEGGEARVYSDNAGFTLKNGRSTRIFIDGPTAGEWATANASQFEDDFGIWSLDRDAVIAKKLKDAHYDRFYDSDIYGADDLNDNGDWVHTVNYGYVWRPSHASISRYADWSPYRYGHWRWMPPYGWIWVNDEPWGWATYHHGRWFYDNGYWNWSPYGYYRHNRSWWSGALVVISIINRNICWYPLPYHLRRNNYNANYTRPRRNPKVRGQETIGKVGTPRVTRTPVDVVPEVNNAKTRTPRVTPVDKVPPIGVVGIDTKDFGSKTRSIRTVSPAVAKTLLSKPDTDGTEMILPSHTGKHRNFGPEIAAENPKIGVVAARTEVGAAPRIPDRPMDNVLQTRSVFGDRKPMITNVDPVPVRQIDGGSSVQRKTGAVDRPPVVRQINPETPRYTDPSTPKASPQFEYKQMPRPVPSTPKESVPRYNPPTQHEKPRYTPPPTRETPRTAPPQNREKPPRSNPPPVKSEPKPENKPAPPASRKEKPDRV